MLISGDTMQNTNSTKYSAVNRRFIDNPIII